MRLRITILAGVLTLAACGGTTAEVVIESTVINMENGTFRASGDLFNCSGRWATLGIHMNESDTWWFEDERICNDGSGTLVIRAEGDGAEPTEGEGVGTWTIVSGSGDYEGFTGQGTYDLSFNPWTERFEGELTAP